MRSAIVAAWVCCGLFLARPAFAQQGGPARPCVQREVQAISVSLKTGWRGKKETSETYGPPPGFVIVEHRVDLKKKDGNVNYSVSILPDKFTGITAEEVKSTYSKLADAAAKLHLVDYQAKLQLEQQDLLKRFEMKSVSSGVICVKASIEGSGELDFVVFAKIANTATNVSLSKLQRLHMENLQRLAANPKCADLKDVLYAQECWQCPGASMCHVNDENQAPGRPTLDIPKIAIRPAFPAETPIFRPAMPACPVAPPPPPR